MRRLLGLVCAIVLVDTSFYAAITPLLPYYADHQHLTKLGAGVLAGSYAAGTLLASFPAGAWSARFGPRALLVCGLALLAITSVTFGQAHSIVLLDLARFAQGVGGALSWTAGLTWLSAVGPPDRRGELLGTAIGAATAGALLGPVIGAVARTIGPAPTFGFIALVALTLMVLMLVQPLEAPKRMPQPRGLSAALRQHSVVRGLWLVACASMFFGVLNVLLPLRMDSLGASGAAIASVFLVSAALEMFVNPAAGRWGDRRGFVGLARTGLIASGILALVASLPETVPPLAAVGIASGPLVGLLWIPGFALLSYGSDEAHLDHAYAYALLNVVWAGAQMLGAAGGGALAHATSDAVPYAIVAAFAFVTLALATSEQGLHRSHPALARKA